MEGGSPLDLLVLLGRFGVGKEIPVGLLFGLWMPGLTTLGAGCGAQPSFLLSFFFSSRLHDQ